MCFSVIACGSKPSYRADSDARIVPQAFELTKGNQRIVLIGTFHSNNSQVISIADRLAPEVQSTEVLMVEVDKRKLSSASISGYYYRPGGRLSRDLSQEAYSYYQEKLAPRISGSIERLRPMTVYILSVLPDEGLSDNGPVMDDYLISQATNNGVTVTALETFEEQFKSLYSLNEFATVQILESQIHSEEQQSSEMVSLQSAYIEGDLNTVYEQSKVVPANLSENTTKAVLVYLDGLIEGRNLTMWQRIEENMNRENLSNAVIAVGCAHLVGPKGLVQLAIDAGYEVKPYRVPEGA